MELYNTKFYQILKSAKNSEESTIIIIEQIMPLINKYSYDINNHKINEDLKSYLIEYAMTIIRDENLAEKLAIKK